MKYQLLLLDRTGPPEFYYPNSQHFKQLTAFILQHLNQRISTLTLRKKAPHTRMVLALEKANGGGLLLE